MTSREMRITLPVEALYNNQCVLLIAPMFDKEKGWGFVSLEVTRELMADQCNPLLVLLDQSIDTHKPRCRYGWHGSCALNNADESHWCSKIREHTGYLHACSCGDMHE